MIVPARAIDCHVHVFDPARFPFAADASYRPSPCECGTADDPAAVLDSHGIARALVVTPTSGYGDDNSCTLDALERLGPRARGIARVPVSISPRALDALAERSVVGVRLDFVALGRLMVPRIGASARTIGRSSSGSTKDSSAVRCKSR